MSRLQIFDDTDGTTPLLDTADLETIASELAQVEVVFERWPTLDLGDIGDPAAILDLYAPEIARLKARGGYRSVDVMSLAPNHPERATLRDKFLSEHVHAEDEVRFFVDGAGLFTLHEGGRVFNMLCTAGDLIAVPAGMKHWFDMGAAPRFTVIRLFVNPDGWVARFTGDPIAARFPRHEPVAA
ncbi:cupin [Sphingomonas sp. RT2P30]|uniref:1,2-dihydroxy-3-keto-5-methylthiopentene dioxygenase n=1 Tax=Parasphingomonas halimpatiens TaxID=3096162 RepID=UPI002FCA8723